MKLNWIVNSAFLVAFFATNGGADFLGDYCGNHLSPQEMDNLRTRPTWQYGVNDKFKEVQNLDKISGPGVGWDLCHVVSWKHIRDSFLKTGTTGCSTCFLERIKKAFSTKDDKAQAKAHQDIKRFLNDLFTPDSLAIAPVIAQDPNTKQWSKKMNKNHVDILKKTVQGNKSLYVLNQEMLNEVRNFLNPASNKFIFKKIPYAACVSLKLVLQMLNSAPANLRYGVRHVNQMIKEYTDPMGKSNGIATTQEKKWLRRFPCCYYHGINSDYNDCPNPDATETCWSSTASFSGTDNVVQP